MVICKLYSCNNLVINENKRNNKIFCCYKCATLYNKVKNDIKNNYRLKMRKLNDSEYMENHNKMSKDLKNGN